MAIHCKLFGHEWRIKQRSNVIQFDDIGRPLRLFICECQCCMKSKQMWIDSTECKNDVVLQWFDDAYIPIPPKAESEGSMTNKKYRLILLKDLPNYKAGTVVLNISQEELDGTKDYEFRHYVPKLNFSEIYDLRNNSEWVKVEEDNRCDCLTKDYIEIRHEIIGYGRSLNIGLKIPEREIYTYYDYRCDSGNKVCMPIKYCPLCGRKLDT